MTKINKSKIKMTCPECGSNSLIKSKKKNETYCKKCGTVLDELLFV